MNKLFTKTFGTLCAALAIGGFAPAANATSALNTISDVTIEGTQYARVAMSGAAITGRPACHNASYTVHYQWDISTAKGKAMLSAIQAAQLAGKRISAYGGTTCTTGTVTLETLQGVTVWTI